MLTVYIENVKYDANKKKPIILNVKYVTLYVGNKVIMINIFLLENILC